ncbi:hypothetical protein H0H81_006455 [Sphagnurus paluster]|uniref:AB hydrolase-1 domain-containing protein n=1 Tax=Sphagnurus paluster TaxID=117069 RepID=A0A9P7GL37_9AGAR|nr:hypothetical protein H0H81_006455 [Sphagnurus paluster]
MVMDPSFYRSATTRRGLTYSYYFSAPKAGKPFLLFAHGFPSTSYIWRYQVDFFKARGFGLIVPDLLGVGGTEKPTNPIHYKLGLMSQDLVDILDVENIEQVVAIGQIWGSVLLSRLANYYPERLIALAFFGVGYYPPHAVADNIENEVSDDIHYDFHRLGFWEFFAAPDTHLILEKNIDSFYSLLLADDIDLWNSILVPPGATKAWVEANRRTPLVSYVPEEELDIEKERLKGSFESSLCWFKVPVLGLDAADSKSIQPENFTIKQPVFFGASMRDKCSRASPGKVACQQYCEGPLTVKEFDTGHWPTLEARNQVNAELLEWIQRL